MEHKTGEKFYSEELGGFYSLDFFWVLKSRKMRDGMCLIWERREIRTGFWWGNLRGKEHLEDLGIHVKMDLNEACVRM